MVVYPRWRGELDRTASVVSSGSGLSPLARGTPVFANLWTIAIRFIPAGAGNTGSATAAPMTTSVYPRWRGEHCSVVFILPACHGLSPLARGTLPYRLPDIIFLRFIPAGAGNTTSGCRRSAWSPVYPRWRGEHIYQNISFYSHGGLSPLARGTRIKHGLTRRAARFIPRWRGEHSAYFRRKPYEYGLSPLARGTHRPGNAAALPERFIPAGAGNTLNITYY
ncbi:Domain of uncharacterised function (DUF2825) [Escherichia coli]|uniref:Domain of uncharacterized function (DUF2825) n=1 Tax=Escherichia coli TaxID=562 RepID=A0A2X1M5E1_ECOLX|nr:Domain of uncharacterised function (DUF2825) [Escherichia coli]